MHLIGRKRLHLLLAAGVVLIAIVLLALPLVASTRIVTDRIAAEISELSGYHVDLGAPPEITVWPSFQARLKALTLTPPADQTDVPAIRAESVTATLDAWAALRGEIRFRAMSIDRPIVTLFGATGYLPRIAAPRTGRFADAISAMRANIAADAEKPETPADSGVAPGIVTIRDGRLEIAGDEASAVTSIDATLAWMRLDGIAKIEASGIWRGEPVRFTVETENGILLLGGGRTSLDVSAEAKPAELSFSGDTVMSQPMLAEGRLRVAATSLKHALEWSGGPASAMAPAEAFSVEADFSSAGKRAKLADARMTMGEKSGSGVVEVDLGEAVPMIAGTLAFEELDLTPFVPAAAAPSLRAASAMPAVESGFSGPFVVDLRLSADRAMLGPVAIARAAATINIRPELAAFDLSDATALGGTIQAGFRATRTGGGGAEIAIHATDIDAELLADAFMLTQRRPSGKASITAMIKGPAGDWNDLIEKGEGTLSVKLGSGAIADFDYARFDERARKGGFFSLGEVSGGSIPVNDAEIRAAIAGGLARIENCEIRSPLATIALNGVVPLPGKGLALSGIAVPAGDTAGAPLAFFVGGSWSAPFFSATPPSKP